MSTDGPQPAEWLAIALLVEASLTLSYEWKRLFQDYIVQLLQRCSIGPSPTNPNKLTRVAFITYGTADSQPTPIVKKIYFTELRHIIQDIKDDSRRLGIGQTDSGGRRGMAALEGFAAVLDMFDTLRIMGVPKELDCRVIHIAASPPDSSKHPHWNQSPPLDLLTWEVLPAEFRKRNIQLSGINLFSGLPRFPQLYTQAAAGNPTPPWFNVKTPHHLFINGFATAPKAKRPAEPPAPERTPEAKRARIAPTQPATAASPPNAAGQASPSVQPANLTSPVANSSAGANPTQPLPQPGTQPNAHNLAALQPQVRQLMTQMQFVLAKRKQVEEGLKLMSTRKEALMAQGNTPALNMLESEITKRREGLQKLSQALQVLQAQARGLQRAAPQGTTPQAQQESSQPIQTNPSAPQLARAVTSPSAITTKDPQTPFNPNPATTPRQTPGVQSPIQNAQMTHMRSISTSGVPPQNTTPGPPNNAAPPPMKSTPSNASGLNVQMQKILEIDQRNRQMPPGNMAPSTSGQVMPTEAGMNNNTSVHTMNPAPQQSPQQPQLSNTGSAQSNLVWEGVLTFNGTGSDGNKKEVHTGVSASSSNAANSHASTWPQSMTLVPAQTPAVSIPEFQEWIRKTRPVLCTFKARSPEDETNYQMLVSVMSSKRMYATASWQLPGIGVKENVLIFQINNMGLCGAFFPLTGIPEMPKSLSAPPIPAPILSLISQLPPEQRPGAIVQIRAKLAAGPEVAAPFFRMLLQRQQQQQQQNAQNRAVMANQFGLNPPGMTQQGAMSGGVPNAMGMMGMNTMNTMNAMGSNPFAAMGNPSGMMPNMSRTGTGGATMNLNYDVLQSFMQRNNPDGNNPPGMGPS